MDILQYRERLNSWLGELSDLKEGFLKEIVIIQNEDADLLRDLISGTIEDIDLEIKQGEEHNRKEKDFEPMSPKDIPSENY